MSFRDRNEGDGKDFEAETEEAETRREEACSRLATPGKTTISTIRAITEQGSCAVTPQLICT